MTRLARQRHVGDGDEPSRQGVRRHRRSRPRPTCASCWRCPANYKVLFLQGGATGAVRGDPDEPRRAGRGGRLRQHRRLVEEGHRRGQALLQGERRRRLRGRQLHRSVPARAELEARRRARPTCTTRRTRPSAASSSTYVPDVGDVPLVADMSSTILSRPIDVSALRRDLRRRAEEHRPAGLVRRDRARRPARPARAPARRRCSTTRRMAADGSMLNTPPTFGWYVAGLVFQWLKRQGGLARHGERTTAPRPSCSTPPSTARASTTTRSRATAARG